MHRCLLIGFCMFGTVATARADDWPQWLGPQRDGVWRESGLLDEFPPGGPKVLWRTPIGGGYAGPAVADGKVYVTDYLTEGDTRPDPGKRNELEGKERILCLDSKTGKQIWKHEYDRTYKISYPAGPRATPAIADGKVYSLGAEGNLVCLDAKTGKLVWSHDLQKEYRVETPQWGFCGQPLVDGNKLISLVGGKGSVLVAFDKDTGKELWRALTAKEPGYGAPMIYEAGGVRQLILWHPESINSVDPETGKLYWSAPLVPSYGMSIMGARKEGDYLFAGGIGPKSLLLKLDANTPKVTEVWRGERDIGLDPVNMTPFLTDGMIYGVSRDGAFVGAKLDSGEHVWKSLEPFNGKKGASATAFVVKNGDRYVLFTELGDLILAKLSPQGYKEVSRAKIIEPTGDGFGRPVVWSHPAFANKCVFARNDKEIVCVSLAKE